MTTFFANNKSLLDEFKHLLLRILRKIYFQIDRNAKYRMIAVDKPKAYKPKCDKDVNHVSKLIYDRLTDNKPCMICRFGNTEMNILAIQYEINKGNHDGIKGIIDYIQGKRVGWWQDKGWLHQFYIGAGFYPINDENINRFYDIMVDSMKEVDILATWVKTEQYFEQYLNQSYKIALMFKQLYFVDTPWTYALKGKKVLIVHPFASTIAKQYSKRDKIWKNPKILPQFDLRIVKAVQSIGGNSDYPSWFEALEHMKSEIEKVDFEICLLGCGAYGFPLAAHVKKLGKKAVHIGGALQLLFGIKGKRWDKDFANIYNEYWVRPSEDEKPQNASSVEGGCYW